MKLRLYSTAVASALLVAASNAFAQGDSLSDATSQSPVVRHTVKRGDTLWDIAAFYLKDPFRWPKVFHANTEVVKNPHWIYPGQVLTIPRGAVRDDIAARTDRNGYVVSQLETRPTDQSNIYGGRSSTTASDADENGQGYTLSTVPEGEYQAAPLVVSKKQPLVAGEIVGAVDRPALGLKSDAGYTLYDRLYVTAPPGLLLHKGDRLLLASKGDAILDVGQVIEPSGILRVDSIQANGPVLGTVVRQFREIKSGFITLPSKQKFQSTTVRPVVGTYATEGKVLWIRKRPPFPSVQTYVIIGVTSGEQVQLGDQFTLYDQSDAEAAAHVPPAATAVVQIVQVTPAGASGIIVSQSQPHVQEEMPARLTAKMP